MADSLDQQLETLNQQIAEEQKRREAHLEQINTELARLEAEKAQKLAELEEQRTAGWREARRTIPQETNREVVEHKITQLYPAMGWKPPAYVIFCTSPRDFQMFGRDVVPYHGARSRSAIGVRLRHLNELCEEDARTPDTRDPFRHIDLSWKVLHRIPKMHEVSGAKELFNLVGDILDLVPRVDNCVVLEKPREMHVDGRNRLHNPTGPAVLWRDGTREWWFDGVSTTRDFIEGTVTLAKIRNERNQERRRLLLERFGYENYLKDAKARLIHEDEKGKLWRIPARSIGSAWNTPRRTEPEYYVEVLNATPEPDGEKRRFFLRVPPTVTTASQAVAWTFNKNRSSAYKPKVET